MDDYCNGRKPEEWRPVVGFEGRYEISSLGRVKGLRHRWGEKPPHIRKASTNEKGYFVTTLKKNGRATTFKIHRLVAEAFIGPRPLGHEVNHIEGIKANNRVENLEYVTPSQNIQHSIKLGLFGCGKKLKADDIPVIRHMLETQSCCHVGRIFKVSASCIVKIRDGKTWGHVA